MRYNRVLPSKEFADAGAKPSYIHGHARAIRTFLRFLHDERYISEPVKFQMPPSGNEEGLPFFDEAEVGCILKACETPRDKALILLMVDSGLRRAEVVALNWSDVDIKSGVVNVKRGKGGKSRSVVIGAKSRRPCLPIAGRLKNRIMRRSSRPMRGGGLPTTAAICAAEDW